MRSTSTKTLMQETDTKGLSPDLLMETRALIVGYSQADPDAALIPTLRGVFFFRFSLAKNDILPTKIEIFKETGDKLVALDINIDPVALSPTAMGPRSSCTSRLKPRENLEHLAFPFRTSYIKQSHSRPTPKTIISIICPHISSVHNWPISSANDSCYFRPRL